MDILDIILGSALTPQGEIESFAARAEKAVADANAAVSNIESITEQTNANNAAAQDALDTVNEALNNLNIPESIAGEVNTELDKLAFELTNINTTNMNSTRLIIHKPNGNTTNLDNLVTFCLIKCLMKCNFFKNSLSSSSLRIFLFNCFTYCFVNLFFLCYYHD